MCVCSARRTRVGGAVHARADRSGRRRPGVGMRVEGRFTARHAPCPSPRPDILGMRHRHSISAGFRLRCYRHGSAQRIGMARADRNRTSGPARGIAGGRDPRVCRPDAHAEPPTPGIMAPAGSRGAGRACRLLLRMPAGATRPIHVLEGDGGVSAVGSGGCHASTRDADETRQRREGGTTPSCWLSHRPGAAVCSGLPVMFPPIGSGRASEPICAGRCRCRSPMPAASRRIGAQPRARGMPGAPEQGQAGPTRMPHAGFADPHAGYPRSRITPTGHPVRQTRRSARFGRIGSRFGSGLNRNEEAEPPEAPEQAAARIASEPAPVPNSSRATAPRCAGRLRDERTRSDARSAPMRAGCARYGRGFPPGRAGPRPDAPTPMPIAVRSLVGVRSNRHNAAGDRSCGVPPLLCLPEQAGYAPLQKATESSRSLPCPGAISGARTPWLGRRTEQGLCGASGLVSGPHGAGPTHPHPLPVRSPPSGSETTRRATRDGAKRKLSRPTIRRSRARSPLPPTQGCAGLPGTNRAGVAGGSR